MASILNMVKGNAMKTILYFLIIILSLFPSFSFSGEGACVQGDCLNGQGRKIYSDGKIHDGYWVEGQYVDKEQTVDYLIKEKLISPKSKTKNGKTALDLALHYGQLDVVTYFIDCTINTYYTK